MLAFFQWCYATPVGETIRDSSVLFPVIEAFHLLGLAVTIGAVLIVDMRLLGVGLTREPVGRLWTAVQPWLIGSIALMFATGILLFLSEAIKCFYSIPFWIKMASLLLVLVFTFTLLRRAVQTDVTAKQPRYGRLLAITSLVLWFGVAWGGRWIGFS